MPTLKLRNSQTQAAAPTGLVQGEVALNERDGILYYRDSVSGNSTALIWSGGTFTGAARIFAGSGAAPNIVAGLGVSGDPDTGLAQLGGANTIGVVTAGTERIRVSSTGNVGIATTSPAYALDVSGTARFTSLTDGTTTKTMTQVLASSATALSGLSDVTITTPSANQVLEYNGTAWVNAALTKSDVGLANVDNTSDANKPISTATQTALDAKASLVGATFTGQITLTNGSSIVPSFRFAGDSFTGLYLSAASVLNVSIGGSNRFAFDNAQFQAFGGTNPAAPNITFLGDNDTGLFNRGANQLAFATGGFTAGMFDVNATNAHLWVGGVNSTTFSPQTVLVRAPLSTGTNLAGAALRIYAGAGTGNGAGGTLSFWTAPSEAPGTTAHTPQQRMTISATGNVGIGTTTPSSALHVVGATQLIGPITEGYVNTGNTGTAQTIALTSGTVQNYTLTGNCTFTMPTAVAGQSFTVLLRTGTGSFTATFTGVKWPASVAPTITTTASRMDILTFVSDGTSWYGAAAQNYTP